MATSPALFQATASSGLPTRINELMRAVGVSAIYGIKSIAGLVVELYGGRYNTVDAADDDVTLTASTTNYVVAHRTTGAISSATSTTNWNDTSTYARLWEFDTNGSGVTDITDARLDAGGLLNSGVGAGGIGDVVGPGSAVDDRIVTFDGTTGKLIQDGGRTVAGLRSPAVQSVSSSATVTPTFLDDIVIITAQAAGLTLANPTGTAIDGLGIVIRIKDNGTARAISYGTQYRAIGVTLPTTTVISKTLYLAMVFNNTDTKWDVLAVGQEA